MIDSFATERVQATLEAMAEVARRAVWEWARPIVEDLEHLVQGEYEEDLNYPCGCQEWDVFV